jgi:hypothetical protein
MRRFQPLRMSDEDRRGLSHFFQKRTGGVLPFKPKNLVQIVDHQPLPLVLASSVDLNDQMLNQIDAALQQPDQNAVDAASAVVVRAFVQHARKRKGAPGQLVVNYINTLGESVTTRFDMKHLLEGGAIGQNMFAELARQIREAALQGTPLKAMVIESDARSVRRLSTPEEEQADALARLQLMMFLRFIGEFPEDALAATELQEEAIVVARRQPLIDRIIMDTPSNPASGSEVLSVPVVDLCSDDSLRERAALQDASNAMERYFDLVNQQLMALRALVANSDGLLRDDRKKVIDTLSQVLIAETDQFWKAPTNQSFRVLVSGCDAAFNAAEAALNRPAFESSEKPARSGGFWNEHVAPIMEAIKAVFKAISEWFSKGFNQAMGFFGSNTCKGQAASFAEPERALLMV